MSQFSPSETTSGTSRVSRAKDVILTLNGGSSSLKFAVFLMNTALERVLSGVIDRIGMPDAELRLKGGAPQSTRRESVAAPNHASCLDPLLEGRANLGNQAL